jgi:Druantia protein DruA
LMLKLHRAGLIELPAKVCAPKNPLIRHPAPSVLDEDGDWFAQRPLDCSLRELGPLRIEQVRRTRVEGLVGVLLARHHYLGYTRPVGEHLKYLVHGAGQPIAALIFSSAPRHLAPRDRFIGWDAAARRRNLRLIAINTRYLIMPWVRVSHLASHLLGHMARRLSADWQRIYGHPIHYLETFTDPRLFAGTCYRAANWRPLGLTTGRGKDDLTKQPNRSLKLVWGYPLTPRWRELLQGGAP